MKNLLYRFGMTTLAVFMLMTVIATGARAQETYRTFNQNDLELKKAKVKVSTSTVCFTFTNDSLPFTVNSLHVAFNAEVVDIADSGGFTSVMFGPKRKQMDLKGKDILPGGSVTLCVTFEKKGVGRHVNFWQWDTGGVRVGTKHEKLAGTIEYQVLTEPNGGTVREYLYKKVITRPNGLVIGIPTPTPNVGWIRYKTADRKYFPHTNDARCFDNISKSNGVTKPFVGELKNPHVKKHNNHLLGELHALKLAIIANEADVTEPDTGLGLGDLLYNDLANGSDPCNGLTINEIAHLGDSALTYCADFVSTFYPLLDSGISRINRAFDGPYVADGIDPLHIKGTHALSEIPFLHPNPAASSVHRSNILLSNNEEVPQQSALMQNYPNPFNPTTTIDFTLSGSSIVTLKVYNLLGQEVATLLNGEEMEDGEQSVEFDASRLTSGVYFYRIAARGIDENTEAFQSIKRMVLLK